MIEGQASSQSQSQSLMNSQMKVEELSFFEELRINLNLQKTLLYRLNLWNSDSLGKIFHLADFFHLAIFCQVEKSCELEKLAKCLSLNFLFMRKKINHFSIKIF